MDVNNFIEVYGEIGIVVFSLFIAFVFFLKRYETAQKVILSQAEKSIEILTEERDKWQQVAITNFDTIANEKEKVAKICDSMLNRTEDLDTILKVVTTLQNKIKTEEEKSNGR